MIVIITIIIYRRLDCRVVQIAYRVSHTNHTSTCTHGRGAAAGRFIHTNNIYPPKINTTLHFNRFFVATLKFFQHIIILYYVYIEEGNIYNNE